MTYIEILYDLIKRLYPEFIKVTGMVLIKDDDGFNRIKMNVKTNLCYSIGFRHHQFHPLVEDPERIWQIKCTNLAGKKIQPASDKDWLPILPRYSPKIDTSNINSIQDLIKISDNSFNKASNYINSVRTNKITKANNIKPKEINYGYILRVNSVEKRYSILIESDLLKFIRSAIYNKPLKMDRQIFDPLYRLNYNFIKLYLSSCGNLKVIDIYPDWSNYYKTLSSVVNKIIVEVLHIMRRRYSTPMEDALIENKDIISKIATGFAKHIQSEEGKINPYNDEVADAIKDFIVDVHNTQIYVKTILALSKV
jgi:hypothetical protein